MDSYIFEIKSRVAGIPCIIGVTAWEPYRPGRLYGPPEDCYPDEGGYGEWNVLDSRGRRALWLERKLTAADVQRIDDELFSAHCNPEELSL